MARQREWVNESNVLVPGDGTQFSTTIDSGKFDKGTTMVRILADFSITPTVVNTNAQIWLAIWSGAVGGAPVDISSNDQYNYLYWTEVVMRVPGSTGPDWFQYRTIDVRGQRQARSGADEIRLMARGLNSGANIYVSSRVLLLLP